ncbi:hypothetical protein [Ruminococcus albus]|uniref:hypothetical protein n=1 Tax=Ruminococcus albus TaxID=1264 RepID=UPI0012BBF5EE|nr:hypothetical protein [Ruminococcus albus]
MITTNNRPQDFNKTGVNLINDIVDRFNTVANIAHLSMDLFSKSLRSKIGKTLREAADRYK